jgi:LacI family transcriptional regulator
MAEAHQVLGQVLDSLSVVHHEARNPGSRRRPVDQDQRVQRRCDFFEFGISHTWGAEHQSIAPAAGLAGPAGSASNRLRLEGLEAFRNRHPQVEVSMLDGGSDFDTGHEAVDAVLDSGATGILAFNDLVAMGLMSGLHERGVSVPGDISITGFDDIPFARYTTPTLTTAAVPISELGGQAWHQLRALIRKEDLETPDTRYQPRLEIRASSGPSPADLSP